MEMSVSGSFSADRQIGLVLHKALASVGCNPQAVNLPCCAWTESLLVITKQLGIMEH